MVGVVAAIADLFDMRMIFVQNDIDPLRCLRRCLGFEETHFKRHRVKKTKRRGVPLARRGQALPHPNEAMVLPMPSESDFGGEYSYSYSDSECDGEDDLISRSSPAAGGSRRPRTGFRSPRSLPVVMGDYEDDVVETDESPRARRKRYNTEIFPEFRRLYVVETDESPRARRKRYNTEIFPEFRRLQ